VQFIYSLYIIYKKQSFWSGSRNVTNDLTLYNGKRSKDRQISLRVHTVKKLKKTCTQGKKFKDINFAQIQEKIFTKLQGFFIFSQTQGLCTRCCLFLFPRYFS